MASTSFFLEDSYPIMNDARQRLRVMERHWPTARVFALEDPQSFVCVENWQRAWSQVENGTWPHIYTMLVKSPFMSYDPYFDVEEEYKDDDVAAHTQRRDQLIEIILELCRQLWPGDRDGLRALVLDSSTPTRLSLHIHLRHPCESMDTVDDMTVFCRRVTLHGQQRSHDGRTVIDGCVYSKERRFRTAGSRKNKPGALPLVPLPPTDDTPVYRSMFLDPVDMRAAFEATLILRQRNEVQRQLKMEDEDVDLVMIQKDGKEKLFRGHRRRQGGEQQQKRPREAVEFISLASVFGNGVVMPE